LACSLSWGNVWAGHSGGSNTAHVRRATSPLSVASRDGRCSDDAGLTVPTCGFELDLAVRRDRKPRSYCFDCRCALLPLDCRRADVLADYSDGGRPVRHGKGVRRQQPEGHRQLFVPMARSVRNGFSRRRKFRARSCCFLNVLTSALPPFSMPRRKKTAECWCGASTGGGPGQRRRGRCSSGGACRIQRAHG